LFLLFSWIILLLPTLYNYHPQKRLKYPFVRIEYHISIYSFIYGLLIGDYEKSIIKFIQKYFNIFFIFSSFFPLYYIIFLKYIKDFPLKTGNYLNYWLFVTQCNILSILMYSCILIITMKFQLNNIILDYLGKFTFENYLYHTLLLKLDKTCKIIETKSLFWEYFLIIFVSLYIGEKMHNINIIIISSINKDDNKTNENKIVHDIVHNENENLLFKKIIIKEKFK